MRIFRNRFLQPFLTAFLAGAVACPPPALALRPLSPRNNAGLEEEIVEELNSSAGVEETGERAAQNLTADLVKKFQERVRLENEAQSQIPPWLGDAGWTGRPEYRSADGSKQTYTIEKWVGRDYKVYVLRVGPLVFVDSQAAESLPPDTFTKAVQKGIKLFRIENLTQSVLSDHPLDPARRRVGPYSYSYLMALHHFPDWEGKLFIDLGGGAGEPSLVPEVPAVVMEIDQKLFDDSGKNFEANGRPEGRGFFRYRVDITDFEAVRQKLRELKKQLDQLNLPVKEIVLGSEIGTWPDYYGKVSNETGMALIPVIEQELGMRVTAMIGGGLVYPGENLRAGTVGDDLQALERNGLSFTGAFGRFYATQNILWGPLRAMDTLAWVATAPRSAGAEEERTVFVDAQSIGFDLTGPDNRLQQQRNVFAVLERLRTVESSLDPAQAQIVNIGSGVNPLLPEGPWKKVSNWDPAEPYAAKAAQDLGADYAPINVVTVALAQQSYPAPPERLPSVLLLYRMGPFAEIYNDPAKFLEAVWTVLAPGGWLLLVNPPTPEFHVASVRETYEALRTAVAPQRPDRIQVIGPDGQFDSALAIAVRKPEVSRGSSAGAEEDPIPYEKLVSQPLPAGSFSGMKWTTRAWNMLVGLVKAIPEPAPVRSLALLPNEPTKVFLRVGTEGVFISWEDINRVGSSGVLFFNASALKHSRKLGDWIDPGQHRTRALSRLTGSSEEFGDLEGLRIFRYLVDPEETTRQGRIVFFHPEGYPFRFGDFQWWMDDVDFRETLDGIIARPTPGADYIYVERVAPVGGQAAGAEEASRVKLARLAGRFEGVFNGYPEQIALPSASKFLQDLDRKLLKGENPVYGARSGPGVLIYVGTGEAFRVAVAEAEAMGSEGHGECNIAMARGISLKTGQPEIAQWHFHPDVSLSPLAASAPLRSQFPQLLTGLTSVQIFLSPEGAGGTVEYPDPEALRQQWEAALRETDPEAQIRSLTILPRRFYGPGKKTPVASTVFTESGIGILFHSQNVVDPDRWLPDRLVLDRSHFLTLNWGELVTGRLPEVGPSPVESYMEEAAPFVRSITGSGRKVAVLLHREIAAISPDQLLELSRRLRQLNGYPVVAVGAPEDSSRFEREGFAVLRLEPDRPGAEAVWDTVYVRRPNPAQLIPGNVLPAIITDALARWEANLQRMSFHGFTSPISPIRLDAAPYLNVEGLTEGEVWQIISERFA